MARTRLYRDGVLEAEDFPLERAAAHLDDEHAVLWIDLCAEPDEVLDRVAADFGLHPLAVEDAGHEHQRPKVDLYPGHVFLTAYAVHFGGHGDGNDNELVKAEIDVFVTSRALITVRRTAHFDVGVLTERWDTAPQLAKAGVGFLLHGLLDVVVDGHLVVARQLEDRIEDMEDALFDERTARAEHQREVLRLRKSLLTLRRASVPMREVLSTLMHRDPEVVDDGLRPYYQDVFDHVLFVTESTDSLREMIGTLRETQLNLQGNRMNEIMKQVTSWAAIIAVPTAITGFYGQNVPYPGFEAASGFWTSTVAIVLLSGALYLLFKRRDWL
jgi:magnesium transporter